MSDGTKRYSCSIIDLYDRIIVATINGKSITSKLAVDTLKLAFRWTEKTNELILHRNQESQFASYGFEDYCELNNIT